MIDLPPLPPLPPTWCAWCGVRWHRGDVIPRVGALCTGCAALYDECLEEMLGVPRDRVCERLNALGRSWPTLRELECSEVAA